MRFNLPEPNGSEILSFESDCLDLVAPARESTDLLELPLMGVRIQAGFPSPAEDWIDRNLDLNQFLVEHPAATYFVRVSGDSMSPNIQDGDYLIVDRSLVPKHNDIVIAALEDELTVKRLVKTGNQIALFADNQNFSPIRIVGEMNLQIWGVVRGVFRKTI